MQALYFIFLSILHWSFSSKPFFQKKFYKICKYEIHQKAMASLRIFEENSENLKYVYRDIIWAISFNLSQIKKRVWNLSMERRISSFLRQKKELRETKLSEILNFPKNQPPVSVWMIWISGKNSAITMEPTTTAISKIIIGSMIDVTAPTALSTSSS